MTPCFAVCGRIGLPIVIGDPLRDCPLQCRAFVLALNLLKYRLRQVRHVRQPALSDTRIIHVVNRLAKLKTGAVFAPSVTRHSRSERRSRQ